MTAPRLKLLEPLRTAVIADSGIANQLGKYQNAASVHTRRRVPPDAQYPMVVIGPIVSRVDDDGINDFRPRVVIDINVYGDSDAHYRAVEDVADRLYALFHRQPRSLTVENYTVTDIVVSGPTPHHMESFVTSDTGARVGRRVALTIRLRSSA